MPRKGEVDHYFGIEARRKREQIGKTLTQAAKEMQLSPSLLSQIERGVTNPSISTLRTIADYLNTSIGVLLGETVTRDSFLVIRKNERNRSVIQGKGLRTSVFCSSNSNLEFVLEEFAPGGSTGDKPYQHEGEECIFVLKGKIEVTLGDKKHILEEGDFMWFYSTIPHRIENIADGESVATWVDTPPKF